MQSLKKNIEKESEKIEKLREKYENHKITKGELNVKKIHIEEKIRVMDSHMRVLQGGMAKMKRLRKNKRKKIYRTDLKNEC